MWTNIGVPHNFWSWTIHDLPSLDAIAILVPAEGGDDGLGNVFGPSAPRLFREVHAEEKILEAGIGAQGIELGPYP